MPTMRLRSALLVAAATLSSNFPAFAVGSTDTATADAATSAATGTATGNDSPELQEIVVTGIRASLEKSLEIKKDASVVLDSINATEMGRFPDADVADSLEHLPGITIDRTTGGEGIHVNVRGLGPQYNITTLNNRILASDDDSRDLAFDVLPSEVISGADVLKSTQASALEGSIGGTVNLRTASPFDNPGLHGGVHAEGNDNDMSDLKALNFPPSSPTLSPTIRWAFYSAACIRIPKSAPIRSMPTTRTSTVRRHSPSPTRTGRRLLPRRAASPSDPSSTTRSATRSPAASSGVRTRASKSSPTDCGLT